MHNRLASDFILAPFWWRLPNLRAIAVAGWEPWIDIEPIPRISFPALTCPMWHAYIAEENE